MTPVVVKYSLLKHQKPKYSDHIVWDTFMLLFFYVAWNTLLRSGTEVNDAVFNITNKSTIPNIWGDG